MTKYDNETIARNTVISYANRYVGTKEGSNTHNIIIDTYNTQKPLPRNYKVKYTDAWCATFVTYVFMQVGLRDIIYPECGCQEMLSHMNTAKPNNSNCKRGNLVFYDWDSNKHADHVGIITDVLENGKMLRVIEGNKNDMVDYRTVPVNSSTIQCIAIPKYNLCIDADMYYSHTGWQKDNNGWWYAYGTAKGSYHKNNAVRIDNKLYMFDTEGYLVDGKSSSFNSDGSVNLIKGKRLAT